MTTEQRTRIWLRDDGRLDEEPSVTPSGAVETARNGGS